MIQPRRSRKPRAAKLVSNLGPLTGIEHDRADSGVHQEVGRKLGIDPQDLLNRFFECAAGSVIDRGGEVLKFIGDAVMAIFPLQGGRPVARDALARPVRLSPASRSSRRCPTIRTRGSKSRSPSIRAR